MLKMSRKTKSLDSRMRMSAEDRPQSSQVKELTSPRKLISSKRPKPNSRLHNSQILLLLKDETVSPSTRKTKPLLVKSAQST